LKPSHTSLRRFVAVDANTTIEPSAVICGRMVSASASVPSGLMLTRRTRPVDRSIT
jgi:hypothetical protein